MTPGTIGPSSSPENLVAIDASGTPISVKNLNATVDTAQGTVTIQAADSQPRAFSVLIRETWLRSIVRDPGFLDTTFKTTNYASASWFSVQVVDAVTGISVTIKRFVPEVGKAWYTFGSSSSISLQRPMFVSLAEVPHIEVEKVTMSNSNRTWVEERPKPVTRLGISFADTNTKGQTVVLNRSWLAGLGFANAYFRYADGTPISNTSDAFSYRLSPLHFSILYAFTASDGFAKESDQPYSNVYWDSINRNIYLLSDRRDPAGTNERMSSPAPVIYDQTTSFTIRGTWQTSQQGNWQLAAPLFFMNAANTKIDMANSIYVLYASRDSNLGNQPVYYLRYRDSTGTLRIDFNLAWNANVQVEFMFSYDAPSKWITVRMYDINGNSILGVQYLLGATETFSLGKIGAAAWGSGDTGEPTIIAKLDNLFMNSNRARNGDFEIDSGGYGVPNYWQNWIWTKGNVYRSSEQAKYGSWSIKIADSSTSLDYGFQTNYLTASPGQTFVGSTWAYVVSGANSLCIEAWDAYGTRLAVSCRYTAAHNLWEYVDVSLSSPSGTATVDLLLYSSSGNTGMVYFDGAELRLRRAFWSVTVHNGEPAVPQGLDGWRVAVDRAADLGVSYIRTDFPWNSFQSSNGVWNFDTTSYWQKVRTLVKTRGIDLIPIINGPAPPGVDGNNVYQSFQNFCSGIVAWYGDVPYFQLLNEPNAPPSVKFPWDWNSNNLILNCYGGLVAGAGTNDFTHRAAFRTIVNVAVTAFWDLDLRGILSNTYAAVDIAAIDFYPSSVNNNNFACDDWSPLDTLFGIIKDYNRQGAIMETGYPTQAQPPNGIWYPEGQRRYIDCAFPVILSKIAGDNAASPTTPFVIANWYELFDHLSASYDPLQNYGMIMTGSYGDKSSLADFRSRLLSFSF